MVKTDCADIAREFKFMVQKTQDPKDRYAGAVKLLAEYYYQIPAGFDEEMVAVFATDSQLAHQIAASDRCTLHFHQGNQIYRMNCKTRFVDADEEKYHAAYWHNALFNPAMLGMVSMVGFTPDWHGSGFETEAYS